MWKFQGEVACGAEEEREEVAQPARSHWQGAGFTSQGQALLSACGDTRQTQPLGAQVPPSLSRASPSTFLLGHSMVVDSGAS